MLPHISGMATRPSPPVCVHGGDGMLHPQDTSWQTLPNQPKTDSLNTALGTCTCPPYSPLKEVPCSHCTHTLAAASYRRRVQSPSTRRCMYTMSRSGWDESEKGCHSHRETQGTRTRTYCPPEYWKCCRGGCDAGKQESSQSHRSWRA